MHPGEGDGPTLLLRTHEQNSHRTRASAIVAKSELLKVDTKKIGHKIDDVNKLFNKKNAEIALGGESNPCALFQLFQACETCPVAKFQESVGEFRRR